ncbi:MAG: hypothetical protein HC848_06625 [Limnobacter sp.]|nr:hypothetical protein [Limnobacter sp.]
MRYHIITHSGNPNGRGIGHFQTFVYQPAQQRWLNTDCIKPKNQERGVIEMGGNTRTAYIENASFLSAIRARKIHAFIVPEIP